MRVLSLCTGMGLLDRAFLDVGIEVVAGCEIDAEQRMLYGHLCGSLPMVNDIADLPAALGNTYFDGIIGGPPCQPLSSLRARHPAKFPDLTAHVQAVIDRVEPRFFLLENVARLPIRYAAHSRMNAMHYAKPHQSRERWFTHSANLTPPAPLYSGDVDDLMAYAGVYGRLYGPKRAAILQGYPLAADIPARCGALQSGIVNAVHYPTALAWARSILSAFSLGD